MTDKTVEQRARELLAAGLRKEGMTGTALSVDLKCEGPIARGALRAIARALEQPEGREAVDDAALVAAYDAVSRANLTRDVKTDATKAQIVRAAIAAAQQQENRNDRQDD